MYLAFVAFLPFPIRLVGTYDENPVAWCFLALNPRRGCAAAQIGGAVTISGSG